MPKDELYELNIGNINGGKVLEAIQDAIGKAMANVRDPNTKAEQKRKVVVTLTFAPNRERNYAEVEAKVETKLAGLEPTEGSVHITAANGHIKAYIRDIAQDELFIETEPAAGKGKPS